MPHADGLMPEMNASLKGAKVCPEHTLGQALLSASRIYGRQSIVAQDELTPPLSYDAFLSRAVVLSRLLARATKPKKKTIGLMLPTSVAMAASFFGVQFLGRVATMINFTAGVTAVLGACRTAELQTIVTSRAFIEKADLGLLAESIEAADIRLLYLEDLREQISIKDKLAALVARFWPRTALHAARTRKADDAAVILFTSGSEGEPKGVALSHRNILSNIAQFTKVLDVGAWDRMFACLPLYHSFGLTVGALLPLLTGMRCYFYPSPLHYHDVPRLIREQGSTLLLTTDTFLTGYAHTGSAEDFASLRYIVAGAEKLKDQTRAIWENRFGKVIFEGYGVTETSPVLSVNTPETYREGSVGPLLPDMEVALNPVEGIDCGAELWVRGPNVMMGYICATRPGVITPPKEGWHNTGDIVAIDEDGFLSIKGRIKRFAKIGGEMISLVAIEQAVSQLCPHVLHAVVSIPHERRGEAVILVTEETEIDRDALRATIKGLGLSDLSMPREILPVAKIPVLGSGKIDYVSSRQLAINVFVTKTIDAPAPLAKKA